MDNNKTEENFISFLNEVPNLIKKIKDKKHQLPPKLNIVDCVGELTDEVKNSRIIKNMLEIEFIYNNEKISFAKLFIDYLNKKYFSKANKIKYSDSKVEVLIEAPTDASRRIDILMLVDNNAIIIENKINAGDQENQLSDYYEQHKKNKNTYVVYLTRYASDASEYSLSKTNREELGEKFICIGHGDIGTWLESILADEHYHFIKIDDKYKLIYSALIQIIENEKILGGISKEDKVEKELIGDYVKKFIKDKSISNSNEYVEVLNQANSFFTCDYFFNYYKEVRKILKNKYNIKDESTHDLEFFIKESWMQPCWFYLGGICILIQLEDDKKEFGMSDADCTEEEKEILDKLRDCETIKNMGITKKRKEDWFTRKDINEETDSPEKIADEMYNLYKFLKDNGF